MSTFELSTQTTTEALALEDYIATEVCDDQLLVIYYNNHNDRLALAERMKRRGQPEDAALIETETDPCARFSKRECDRAGGCCRWVTSGSFNFCKCV